MSSEVTDQDKVHIWRECFDMYDKNKEGYISPRHLGDVFKILNIAINEEELEIITNELKQSKDSMEIYFEDFIFMMLEKNFETIKEEKTMEIFTKFDIEGTEKISLDDFFEVIPLIETDEPLPVLEEEVEEVLEGLKLSGEDEINYVTLVKKFYDPSYVEPVDEEEQEEGEEEEEEESANVDPNEQKKAEEIQTKEIDWDMKSRKSQKPKDSLV